MDTSLSNVKGGLKLCVASNKHKIANHGEQPGARRAGNDRQMHHGGEDSRSGDWAKEWPHVKKADCVGLGDATITAIEKLDAQEREQWLLDQAAKGKSTIWLETDTSLSGQTRARASWICYKTPELGDGLEVTDGTFDRLSVREVS